MKNIIFEIISNRALTEAVFEMKLKGDVLGIRCGQFVNILIDGLYLRRPISVCDLEGDVLTLVYKVVGKGTQKMSEMKTDEKLDMSRAYVCGHSRLGKTALLTGAVDERVKLAYSNDSGCCGAALSRGKSGESVEDITRVFPQWFCKGYIKYAGNEDKMPFDQHWLIASVAPRRVYVASAFEDKWADPNSEMLSCVAASEAYEACGLRGLVCNDSLPQIGDVYHDGMIGYHLRAGLHYLSREDWNKMIDYVIKQ